MDIDSDSFPAVAARRARMLERLGADLELSRQDGDGSGPDAAAGSGSIAPWTGPERRVLVVEDEALVSLSVSDALTEFGLDVVGVAVRAEQAVSLADSLEPHLVIMDVRLRGDRDGVWACEQIRARRDLPVIFITAYRDPASLARLHAADSAGIIFKPFSIPALLRSVSQTLHDFYGT